MNESETHQIENTVAEASKDVAHLEALPLGEPFAPAEREGLIPTYVTTRAELNEAEQENIAEADRWAFSRKRTDVLSPDFLLGLHKRMLGRVWRWAGHIRATERNIGIAPYLIETELRRLADDTHYWIENRSFEPDEIAVRFHHRLVAIHPFPKRPPTVASRRVSSGSPSRNRRAACTSTNM